MKKNLLIAHSGGPTTVMNAALYGAVREAARESRIDKIIGARHGVVGILKEDFVELRSQPSEIIDALPDIPSSILGSCRHKLSLEECEQVLSILANYQVGCFIYHGGNDSMDTAMRLSHLAEDQGSDIRIVGLPKTVDNDLPETDHCPGFGSAARFYAHVARDMDVDNEALPSPVAVLEVMGRNAGWLAGACALLREKPERGPHLIYIPEMAFDEAAFVREVRAVYERLGRALVVVSEGVAHGDGTPVCASHRTTDLDSFGHPLPGNVGKYLVDLLSGEGGLRARNLKPDLWGRTCMTLQSPTDRAESIELGRRAVQMLLDGRSGVMLTLVRLSDEPYQFDVGAVDLHRVANVERQMPREFLSSDGRDVTDDFQRYARPLIGPVLPPYARLQRIPVERPRPPSLR